MSALKKLPHRSWPELRDQWVDHLPGIDFDDKYPSPTLWDILPTFTEYENLTVGERPYMAGIRESVFREAVLLARKFTYCRGVALHSAREGFPTWSVIAAYDACFYAAKAFCYLLGMPSAGRHSKLYIDIFHWRIDKKDRKKGRVFDVTLVHALNEYLSHNMLWDLSSRLMRTIVLPDEQKELENDMKNFDADHVSYLRNNLIYSGGYWLRSDEIEHCDVSRRLSNIENYKILRSEEASEEDAFRYFTMCTFFARVLTFFFEDISSLAPAMKVEAEAVRRWAA